MKQYAKDNSSLLSEFQSDENSGLSTQQYEAKLQEHGPNELQEKEKPSIAKIFFSQFKDFLVIVLLFANVISLATGNIESSIVIMVVILLNAVLGTVQYVKAEKSLDSLKALSSPYSKVLRNGVKVEIPSREIVPGDVIILEAGDQIPADGRILENYSLQVNESSLTGESEAVLKTAEVLEDKEIGIGDRLNMVFSGSLVTYGRAKVIITETGMSTEIGKIANLLESAQQKATPLQRSLDSFSKKLAIGIFAICIVVFGLSMYRGAEVLDALMFAVALAVAAIPEALSSIVTIVLAIGTQTMAKENAVVKELKSVEGLGSVSVICSDKTGTLTQNKMKVLKAFIDFKHKEAKDIDVSQRIDKELITSAVLCNDSVITDGKEIGDPTEVALVNLADNLNVDTKRTRDAFDRIKELPFDSDRKLMSTINDINGEHIMFTKGAVDVMIGRITHVETEHGAAPLDESHKKMILDANHYFSENGLRVLAFAKKMQPPSYYEDIPTYDMALEDEYDLTFIGLLAMIDPPREEAKAAVADCRIAGIKPVMITGDHRITASAIAKEIGILEEGDLAINGEELEAMSDEELAEKVDKISVYARVSPEHKIRIVKAWQSKEKIVAMTGDGVNDAPALKQADIGIAMGITGTDVSKDAASMILMDDNFATIVKAVTSGRNIFKNITNAIGFLLSGNAAGIIVVLYSSLLALPIPFAAVHLLFINLLTDSLPAIAIGMEPERRDLLKEKPRDSRASIMDLPFLKRVSLQGILISIATIFAFYQGLNAGDEVYARTLAFATLCLARLFHGFTCRGDKSLIKLGLFKNRFSWVSFIAGNIFLLAVLNIYPLTSLFEIAPMSASDISNIYLWAALPTVVIQLARTLFADRK